MSKIKHHFTATVQITSDKPDVEQRSGYFGPETKPETWNIVPQPDHTAFIGFYSEDSAGAVLKLHKIMQRHARGKSDPRNYRKKRATYGPADYRVLEMRHEGTGASDLPRSANPDLGSKPKRAKTVNMEFQFA